VKINASVVRAIRYDHRRLVDLGLKWGAYPKLSKKYNLSEHQVLMIVQRKCWAWVTDDRSEIPDTAVSSRNPTDGMCIRRINDQKTERYKELKKLAEVPPPSWVTKLLTLSGWLRHPVVRYIRRLSQHGHPTYIIAKHLNLNYYRVVSIVNGDCFKHVT
jgi:hypothetical protein